MAGPGRAGPTGVLLRSSRRRQDGAEGGRPSLQADTSHWSVGNCRPIAKRMTRRFRARRPSSAGGPREGSAAGGTVATATPPGAAGCLHAPPRPSVAAPPHRSGAGCPPARRPAGRRGFESRRRRRRCRGGGGGQPVRPGG